MQYRSAEWKAMILDPQSAMRWADKMEREEGEEVASDFRRAFNEGAIFGDEHGEYRYWATGVHEPASQIEV